MELMNMHWQQNGKVLFLTVQLAGKKLVEITEYKQSRNSNTCLDFFSPTSIC